MKFAIRKSFSVSVIRYNIAYDLVQWHNDGRPSPYLGEAFASRAYWKAKGISNLVNEQEFFEWCLEWLEN